MRASSKPTNARLQMVRSTVPLDEASLTADLLRVKADGIAAVAIVFVHAWAFPAHEQRAAEIARGIGFAHVSVSHEVSPLVKLVGRGDTTVADAYLSPVLDRYVASITASIDPDGERTHAAHVHGVLRRPHRGGKLPRP